jgi:hypothetical protein
MALYAGGGVSGLQHAKGRKYRVLGGLALTKWATPISEETTFAAPRLLRNFPLSSTLLSGLLLVAPPFLFFPLFSLHHHTIASVLGICRILSHIIAEVAFLFSSFLQV